MEANPRVADNVSEMDQLLLRPALGYAFTPNWSLWQGYAWIANFQPSFTDEHRIFQQLIYAKRFTSLKIFSRSRLEERIIENADGTAVRARTMLRADFPLRPLPNWALVTYNEIFVNLNSVSDGPDSGFDQNRFFLGFNHKLHDHLNFDIGYQLQLVNNNDAPNLANHILLVQIFLNY